MGVSINFKTKNGVVTEGDASDSKAINASLDFGGDVAEPQASSIEDVVAMGVSSGEEEVNVNFTTRDENLRIDETFIIGSTNAVESREIQRVLGMTNERVDVLVATQKKHLYELNDVNSEVKVAPAGNVLAKQDDGKWGPLYLDVYTRPEVDLHINTNIEKVRDDIGGLEVWVDGKITQTKEELYAAKEELARAKEILTSQGKTIEVIAGYVDEQAGIISDTILSLTEEGERINILRSEMDGINLTISNEILSQLNDDKSLITLKIGQWIDAKNEIIETAIKKLREGTDETMVSWIGQEIDGKGETITTGILKEIESKDYATTTFVGTQIDGVKGTITSAVTESITDYDNNTVQKRFSTVEQSIDGVVTRVGDAEGRIGTLEISASEFSTRVGDLENGGNYAEIIAKVNEEGSAVSIKADKISLLGETVADYLKANEVEVSGTIHAKAGDIAGWIISADKISGGLTDINKNGTILSHETYQGQDYVHWSLNGDGSGSIANGSLTWDQYGYVRLHDNVIIGESGNELEIKNLIEDVSKVLSMFDIDSDGDICTKDYVYQGQVHHRGFYSPSFISAAGKSTGGGGGGGEGADLASVWESLMGNSDDFSGIKVNMGHLDMMSDTEFNNDIIALL